MPWRVATIGDSWHNSTRNAQPLSTGASGGMLEDLDLHSIADDRARELVRQLLNLLEDVTADLRAAQAEIWPAPPASSMRAVRCVGNTGNRRSLASP